MSEKKLKSNSNAIIPTSLIMMIFVGCLISGSFQYDKDFSNPGFEYSVADDSIQFFDNTDAIPWQTNFELEVWGDGHDGYNAFNGFNFVEVNANGDGDSVYQTLILQPDSTYLVYWHMQSRGNDGQWLDLYINDVYQQTFNNTFNYSWTYASYTFLTDSTVSYKIELKGYSPFDDSSSGNFLDEMHIHHFQDPSDIGGGGSSNPKGQPVRGQTAVDPSLTKDWFFSHFQG